MRFLQMQRPFADSHAPSLARSLILGFLLELHEVGSNTIVEYSWFLGAPLFSFVERYHLLRTCLLLSFSCVLVFFLNLVLFISYRLSDYKEVSLFERISD
jgi:hypothetical protein